MDKPAAGGSHETREGNPSTQTILPAASRGRLVARTVFALLLLVLALWTAWNFLAPLAWAAVIAITVWPLYAHFTTLLPGRADRVLAPLVFAVAIGLVLLVPLMLVVHQVAQGSDAFVGWMTEIKEKGAPVPGWLIQLPVAGD